MYQSSHWAIKLGLSWVQRIEMQQALAGSLRHRPSVERSFYGLEGLDYMLRSFITWLDNYLVGEDPSAVVRAIVGIMSFAVLLGVILGNTAIKMGALVAALLIVLSVMLILLADRKALKREANSHHKLLTRYCGFIYKEAKPVALIRTWNQFVTIEKNGDVTELITIHAVALRPQLYFLRLRTGASWPQPEKYRRKVKVEFRSVQVAGLRGPSWDVTPSWLSDGRLEMLAHLHSPISKGTEIQIEMEREWPGKCIPLMKERGPDEFVFNFSQALHIEQATYVVVLPKGVDAYYEPIGFHQSNSNFSVTADRHPDGRPEFTLATKDIPPDVRIGMRLQLK